MPVIDELVTILGFKLDANAVQMAAKFEATIKSISTYAEVMAASLMGAATAALYFVQRANEASSGIDKLGDLTGQNKQSIQLWSRAVEQAGGSAEATKNTIMSLTRALHPVMPGERNEGLLMMFGPGYLKQFKDVDALLLGISKRIKGMNPGAALSWASHIGIPPDLLLLMQRDPGAAMKAVKEQMHVLTDKELGQAREFQTHWVRIKQTWVAAGETAAANLAPVIAKIADRMEKWVKENKEFLDSGIKNFVEGVADGLERFVGLLEGIWKGFKKLIPGLEEFIGKKDAFKKTSDAMFLALLVGSAALIIVNWRFLAIAAAVTAVITAFTALHEMFSRNNPENRSTADKIVNVIESKVEYYRAKYLPARLGSKVNKFNNLIKEASEKYGVPEWLIRGVINKESQFNPNATSKKGAMGLMQLMPDTAKGLGVTNAYDPRQNIMGGTKYLHQMIEKFNGDLKMGLTAYNWGEGNLAKALSKNSGWRPKETRDYVSGILAPEAPVGPNGDGGKTETNINITNNISGDNAPGIASETTRSMSNTLQTLFPGGLAPVTN